MTHCGRPLCMTMGAERRITTTKKGIAISFCLVGRGGIQKGRRLGVSIASSRKGIVRMKACRARTTKNRICNRLLIGSMGVPIPATKKLYEVRTGLYGRGSIIAAKCSSVLSMGLTSGVLSNGKTI